MSPIPALLALVALYPLAPPAAVQPAQEAAADDLLDLGSLRRLARDVQVQIEELRGLEFKQPVEVELADRALYLAYVRQRMEAQGGSERIERDEEVAKLLGLIPGDFDLESVLSTVLEEQAGGFYDPDENTFYVLDSVSPDLVPLVVAHELTHALDDQHFDLGGTQRALQGDSDAQLAHSAVVEGSGAETMLQWAREHLGTAELERLGRTRGGLPGRAIHLAPPFVWKPLIAIYNQGQSFLRRQARMTLLASPARSIDVERALEEPPRSTEQVLHPVKYWNRTYVDEPQRIGAQVAPLPAGFELLLEDTLGELVTAMVTTPFEERSGLDVSLSGLLSLEFTNEAAAGWGGDRYLLLGRDGERGRDLFLRLCTRWDSIKDATEFAEAVGALAEEIEESKAAGGSLDPDLNGFRIESPRDDEVFITSWCGLTAEEVDELCRAISFFSEPAER